MLTIYFTSDTHGYLYPTNFASEQPQAMGLLSMSFPRDGNTLVIDGGDTTQGSPLTYFCHQEGRPTPAADALNRLGYDYVTLGNHDFNYGYDALRDYLRTLNARCLCANVQDKRGELSLLPCCVHTLANGTRVGLVGVVTDWVNLWEKPENLTELSVTSPMEAARKAVASLDADLLVGIYHGGVERDPDSGRLLSDTDENIAWKLCEELPFDILLTGHQHIPMAGKTICGTHVVQTPCNATAYVKITVDDRKRIASELCPAADHCSLTAGEQALYADLQTWLDQPIGRLSQALWPEDKLSMALHGSGIADLINMVQLSVSGAELACTCLSNELRGFDASVTVRDVVASYPYANTLVVLEVTGRILRMALEQCATYFQVEGKRVSINPHFLSPKVAHFNYDYFLGLEYAFDLRRPVGSRVALLKRNGRDILDDDRFTLCMNNYRATGAGDFAFYAECPHVKEIQTDMSELIIRELSERKWLEIPEKRPYTCILP